MKIQFEFFKLFELVFANQCIELNTIGRKIRGGVRPKVDLY